MTAIGTPAIEAASEMITSVHALFAEASLNGLATGDAKALSWKVSGLTVQAGLDRVEHSSTTIKLRVSVNQDESPVLGAKAAAVSSGRATPSLR